MTKSIKVSILTPCYNSEDFLERYLLNILEQSYSNIEQIIVNDGSQDRTEEIALSFVDKYKERGLSLIYIKQENKGVGGAINTALKYITGEYFCWCDSDNFFANDYVEKKVKFFESNPDYSMVRCDGYIVDSSDISKVIGTMAPKEANGYKDNLFEKCLRDRDFHYGCAMIKTVDFDKVNPTREIYPSRHGQNWQLLLPMLYNYKVGYIDEPLFYFVRREGSITHCIGKDRVKKLYQRADEFTMAITTTLEQIVMDQNKKDEYVKEIRIKYAKEKFDLATFNHDIGRMKKEYSMLKELNAVGFDLWYKRYIGRFYIGLFTCKVGRRIKLLFTKKEKGQ